MIEITRGVYAAMATPMHEDETINVDELYHQIDRFIDSGIDALFCLGTNGEFYALNVEEKRLVMGEVIRYTDGRVPVFCGVGSVTNYIAGRDAEAEAAQQKLANVRSILVHGNPNSITKAATNVVGHPVGPARTPARVSKEVVGIISEFLESNLDYEKDV